MCQNKLTSGTMTTPTTGKIEQTFHDFLSSAHWRGGLVLSLAERTKRLVNPEVPWALGLPAVLTSAHRAAPGILQCTRLCFRMPANALSSPHGLADAKTFQASGIHGLRRIVANKLKGCWGLS